MREAVAPFVPVPNRGMITLSIMMANIMQGVDNSILNVALPHIPGSLVRENAIDNAVLPELTADDLYARGSPSACRP